MKGGAMGGIWLEEPSLMTWVLLWSARSSDISSRAAQETNLSRHKCTGWCLGRVEGVCQSTSYHKFRPKKMKINLKNAISYRQTEMSTR